MYIKYTKLLNILNGLKLILRKKNFYISEYHDLFIIIYQFIFFSWTIEPIVVNDFFYKSKQLISLKAFNGKNQLICERTDDKLERLKL